jgi:magnesium chelatase accessory protein
MVTYLDWAKDGADWPNREASRFVDAAGMRWHVQVMGQGPVLLLLHGTGASTHSWRDVMPLLRAPFHGGGA